MKGYLILASHFGPGMSPLCLVQVDALTGWIESHTAFHESVFKTLIRPQRMRLICKVLLFDLLQIAQIALDVRLQIFSAAWV